MKKIDEKKSVTSQKISLIDKEGYLYQTTWAHIQNGRKPEKFHNKNKYTIHNINLFLKNNRNEEYICLSKKYTSNNKELKFKHVPCGTIFMATLIEMQGKYDINHKNKYYKQCPKCNTNKTESNHASVLKQVFLYKYPETVLEDKTCINTKTNRPLPTDIVNHDLKIAIEIQSSFHDKPAQKIIDNFKRDFWISKGYSFYNPDIRDYSILEMVQIFFPDIIEIPSYIDLNFSNCIDYTRIQPLLNDGHTIKEISNMLNIKRFFYQKIILKKSEI